MVKISRERVISGKTPSEYLDSPEETLAWRMQVSFLRQERGMSFPEALEHFRRLFGGTSASQASAPYEEQVRLWYENR